MIRDPRAGPRDLTVEDRVAHGQAGDGCGQRRNVLRQPVARQQPDVAAVPEREQADAVVLALEEPLRPGEPLLGERGSHRYEPLGKRDSWFSQGRHGVVSPAFLS